MRRERLYRIKTVGKLLELGPRRIYRLLREWDFLGADGMPKAWVYEQRLAKAEERQFLYPSGGSRLYEVVLVTEAGYHWIAGKANEAKSA